MKLILRLTVLLLVLLVVAAIRFGSPRTNEVDSTEVIEALIHPVWKEVFERNADVPPDIDDLPWSLVPRKSRYPGVLTTEDCNNFSLGIVMSLADRDFENRSADGIIAEMDRLGASKTLQFLLRELYSQPYRTATVSTLVAFICNDEGDKAVQALFDAPR